MIKIINILKEYHQVFSSLKDKNDTNIIRSILLNILKNWYNRSIDSILISSILFETFFDDLPTIKELSGNTFTNIILPEIHIDLYNFLNNDVFGELYTELMPRNWKNSNGFFFTPTNITEWIVKSSCVISDIDTSHLVLDICVGSGRFFIAYMKELEKELSLNNVHHNIKHSLIKNHLLRLYGFDKDPFSILLTRLHIAMYCYLMLSPYMTAEEFYNYIKIIKMHIQVHDVLEIPKKSLINFVDPNNDLFYKIFYKIGEFKDGFMYIFANPPYMKIQLSGEQKDIYKRSVYGHVNSYGVFFHLAINLLTPGHGQLWFITPESFRSGLYFQNLRKLILEECIFRKLLLIKSRNTVFTNVLQGVGILNLLKKEQNFSHDTNNFLEVFAVDSTDIIQPSMVLSSFIIKCSSIAYKFANIPYYVFGSTLKSYDIFQHVVARSIPLQELPGQFTVTTGQIVWNRVKPLLIEQPPINSIPPVKPLIWSDNYDAYSFTWQGKLKRPRYILDIPQIALFKLEDEIILVKRVTAKEQSRRLIATQVSPILSPYFVENHSNILFSKRASLEDRFFLLGYLNSKLADYIFRLMNGNTQVSATELRIFPIVIVSDNVKKFIAANVQKLLYSNSDLLQRKYYINEIDKLLCKSIELTTPIQTEVLKETKDI